MTRTSSTLAIALLACSAFARPAIAGPPKTPDHSQLADRLLKLAQHRRLAGARVGFVVLELSSGRLLAGHDAKRVVPVASNTKLATAAAALSRLGPNYRFRTAVYAPERDGKVVSGDLVLKGFGDPSLGEDDIWELARAIDDAGVRQIRGGISIDESYFDAQRLAPLYETRTDDAYYRPASAPLSIYENAIAVHVLPGEAAGQPARVLVHPRSSYLKIKSSAMTVNGRRRNIVRVHTKADKRQTVVEVSGRVRPGSDGGWHRCRIEHPALLAGAALADQLRRRGVRVGRRLVRTATAPEKLEPLAIHRSAPLGVIVRYMLKASSNFTAEQLVRVLGAEAKGEPGSWAKGLSVVAEHLASVGVPAGSYQMKNGSGLYEGNQFSPHQLALIVRGALRDFRYGADFAAGLPIARVDGTLVHRFAGSGLKHYVRAKTGTLNKVVSLSGLAGSKDGKDPLVFSIVLTELPSGTIRLARRVADQMATAVVSYRQQTR